MKNRVIIAVALILSMLGFQAEAQDMLLTQQEAFALVSDMFNDRDVDYYSAVSDNRTEDDVWVFFVDADPMALWGHECYLVKVYKTRQDAQVESTRLSSPPKGYVRKPYQVKRRFDSNVVATPAVVNDSSDYRAAVDSQTAGRTYAVLFSGNSDITMNYVQFRNECSFLYQVLRKRYAIPRQNIFALIADGKNPAADQVNPAIYEDDTVQGIFMYSSSDPDLDGDGVDDVEYSATIENLDKVLDEIRSRIDENNHLFMFLTNHGELKKTANGSITYFSTQSGDSLFADDLAAKLMPFARNNVNVNLVIASCHSGGITDFTKHNNFVVTTACEKNETAAFSPAEHFSKFMNLWIAAINGSDYYGIKVDADGGNGKDGFISMDEAYEYAKNELSTYKPQHPQNTSIPATLGKILAFDRLPGDKYDLYLRDDVEDNGYEPSLSRIFWLSPDLSCMYVGSCNDRRVYADVIVHNNSTADYTGGKSLKLYWAQASTAIRDDFWRGGISYGGEPLGGPIGRMSIPNIPAKGSADIEMVWNIPDSLFVQDGDRAKRDFGILAEISEDSTKQKNDFMDVSGNRRLAQYSLSEIGQTDSLRMSTVYFLNPYDSGQKFNFEISIDAIAGNDLLKYANVVLDMTPTVYYSWLRGGKHRSSLVDGTYSPYSVQLLEKKATMYDIDMVGRGIGKINLIIEFFDAPRSSEKYRLNLVQRDSDGKVIGGHTVDIHTPVSVPFTSDIRYMAAADGAIECSVDADMWSQVNWYDSDNVNIGRGTVLRVLPDKDISQCRAVVINSNGELSSCMTDREPGIARMEYNPDKNTVVVEFSEKISAGYSLVVSSVATGEVYYDANVSDGEKTVKIDTSSILSGIYSVSCLYNGTIVHLYKFVK